MIRLGIKWGRLEMVELSAASAEAQRFDHLVLGRPRPPAKKIGKGRSKRLVPVVLAPGIEEAMQLRERWGHRRGTPETHEHVSKVHQGALARLYQSGAIDSEQLASAAAIAAVAERIASDVSVRIASLETRVDSTRGQGTFWERLGQVRAEVAYSSWRASLSVRRFAPIVLDMIVGDVGIAAAARIHRMHVRRARRILIIALDAWPDHAQRARDQVDPATLAASQAAIL